MAITKINTNQLRLSKPTGIVFFPYVRNGVLRGEGFDIHDIVGDTYSGTQDDPDETSIPHEFSDSPLDLSVTLGTETITMQCLDFQDDILKELYGWDTDTADGIAISPAQYKDLNCLVILQFGTQGVNVVMPNVKMNSKSILENLRSDIARGEIGGTLLSSSVILDENPTPVETPKMFVKNGHAIHIGDAVITIAADGTLSISGGENTPLLTTLTFAYNDNANDQTYTVTGETGLTVIENAGWLTATVSGTNNNLITVHADNTDSQLNRSALITVYKTVDGEDVVVGTIKVVQTGVPAE